MGSSGGQTGNLPHDLPDCTLGWGVLLWATRYIVQPDGERAGTQWRFTPEQVRFVLWLYAVDDRGRFVFNGATLRRAKGWGKSPLAALLCLAEFLGPVRFSHWARQGEFCATCAGPHSGDALHPIGKRVHSPWVQIAATSYAQTANTFQMIRGMVVASPAVADYGLDVGKTMVQFASGRPGKIEPVTSSSQSLEGGRPTFAIFEETHHWTESSGGHHVARTVRRNLGKIAGGGARAVEITNAHDPSRHSVAQSTYEMYLAMQQRAAEDPGYRVPYLYDCREAPADVDIADEQDLRRALRIAYGDSTWVDFDRIVAEVYDPRQPVEEARRFFFNQIVAASDAWVRPDQVDAIVEDREIPDGAMIALGFDGSKTVDATALIACDIETGHVWPLGIWERPDSPDAQGWSVPTDEVTEAVRAAFERWDVVAFFADVAYWQSYVDTWAEQYRDRLAVRASARHSVAFDMRGRLRDFTRAAESTRAAIEERTFTIANDVRLIRHIKNARRRPNAFGVGLGKESRESERKVDAAVAMVLAREARRMAIERGRLSERNRGDDEQPGILFGFG